MYPSNLLRTLRSRVKPPALWGDRGGVSKVEESKGVKFREQEVPLASKGGLGFGVGFRVCRVEGLKG